MSKLQSPPLRGGEYPNSTSSQFVHTFIHRRYSAQSPVKFFILAFCPIFDSGIVASRCE